MLSFQMKIVALLVLVSFPLGKGFEPIITPQHTSAMTPGELLVQILTEPESLIRLFDGFNLSFQMLRHLGRTGPALLRLPFDKSFLSNSYDHVGLDSWRKHYYSRIPTMFSNEAPRYIKTTYSGYQHEPHLRRLLIPMHF
ncbi:hypothetical protein AVEN_147828-1 [Araneus ventricosus]|uniref:Uncharacterized protein n=1 Tax=Araneus ventricosus TaxID=182803 RepID=A0A4Y2CSI2_ARAVE|nr:hypothetical protein AVEN_147828-1 [Araneus ventricosus]